MSDVFAAIPEEFMYGKSKFRPDTKDRAIFVRPRAQVGDGA